MRNLLGKRKRKGKRRGTDVYVLYCIVCKRVGLYTSARERKDANDKREKKKRERKTKNESERWHGMEAIYMGEFCVWVCMYK